MTLCSSTTTHSSALHGAKLWLGSFPLQYSSSGFCDLARKQLALSLSLASSLQHHEVLSKAWGKELCFLVGSSSNGEPKNVQRGKAPPEESESELLCTTELLYYYCAAARIWFVMAFLSPFSAGIKITTQDFVCFQKCYLHSERRYAKVGLQLLSMYPV